MLVADLTNEAQVAAAVETAVRAWDGLDCVVGCAGVQLAGQDDRADRLSLEVWRRTLGVNLTGMFLIVKHGIRALLNSGGGNVVLVCSPTGQFGCAPGYDAYSASKAGVLGLVRVLAADYAPDNIRVNGVVPGYTITPMTTWVRPDEHDALLKNNSYAPRRSTGRGGRSDRLPRVGPCELYNGSDLGGRRRNDGGLNPACPGRQPHGARGRRRRALHKTRRRRARPPHLRRRPRPRTGTRLTAIRPDSSSTNGTTHSRRASPFGIEATTSTSSGTAASPAQKTASATR